MLRCVLRLVGGVLVVTAFVINGLYDWRRTKDEHVRLRRTIVRASRWSRLWLRAIGVHIHVRGRYAPERRGGRLIVANHLGYLDPIVMTAVRPAVFVTSVEVEQAGSIESIVCSLAGCLFIERRSYRRVVEDRGMLGEALSRYDVVLFPEGTSSDGSRILPFRSSLYESAVHARADVAAVCSRFTRVDGRDPRRNQAVRDLVCWYADMTLVPHFIRLLSCSRVDIEVTALETIPGSSEADRKDLAARTRATIAACYAGENDRGPRA